MNKHNVFIIDEQPLLYAIRKYGKGATSKDYEYAISIYMKRKLEKDYGEKFSIVFDLKQEKHEPRKHFIPTPEETIKILREMLEENSPVDFGLVKGTPEQHEDSGFAFQVKRFIGHNAETINHDLLNYINRILRKFRPGEVSLIVIPELSSELGKTQANIDVEYLKNNISAPKDSFKAVFLFFYFSGQAYIRTLWIS